MPDPILLPTNEAEAKRLRWWPLDIIIVSGDAYVDHPSFAAAIIGRYLVSQGWKVGILAQPDWRTDKDFHKLGHPRLFFGVTAGNLDSLVANYTPRGRLRSDDDYSPAGQAGLRPDRAVIIYSQKLHAIFPDIPVVPGGIEASLRRIPHYDFISGKIRNSVLFDARADILVYGMGERAIGEIARRIDLGESLHGIPGTAEVVNRETFATLDQTVELPTWEDSRSPEGFLSLTKVFEKHRQTDVLSQAFAGRYLVHYPPAEPLSTTEMDALYKLPFANAPHPGYGGKPIPAFEQIRNSITSHRGCYGGCHFCAIGCHQGKSIQSRSEASILEEVERLTARKSFKGTISDIGGPTADMWNTFCKQGVAATCPRRSCLVPDLCRHLETSHKAVTQMLSRAASIPGVKHLFVASGIRFDLALQAPEYIREIARHYVGGHLKLAPEHTCDNLLKLMNKPSFRLYRQFENVFLEASTAAGKEQYILPYLIVGHPGETLADTVQMMNELKRCNIRVRQVQEFTPTPMTVSTCMYYTGLDFQTGNPIPVPKGREVKLMKALVQWFLPENRELVREALRLVGKEN